MPLAATPTTTGTGKSPMYRLSCDRCQSDKVRCSRDKPSCKRCERRRIDCVYSPFRHIGRPRKVVAEAVARPEPSVDDDSADSVTRSLSDMSPSDSLGRSVSTAATSLDGSCVYGLDTSVGARGPMGSEPLSGSNSHMPSPSQHIGFTPYESSVDVWVNKHQVPLSTPSDPQYHATPRDMGATPSEVNFPATPHSRFAHHRSQAEYSCYTTILRRTLKLEEELSRLSMSPPIDLVLEAEGDFYRLQDRVLECSGHRQPLPFCSTSAPQLPPLANQNARGLCLQTDQPIILGLAILADRIVGMLEALVRLAAQSALNSDQATDVLYSTGATVDPTLSARRMKRSFRNNWVKGCVSLEIEADRNLLLGNLVVQGQAKSAAMRRILKLRVRRMLGSLEVLQGVSRSRNEGGGGGGDKDPITAAALDWGGSGAAMGGVADGLLSDLRRRMESVHGAVVSL